MIAFQIICASVGAAIGVLLILWMRRKPAAGGPIDEVEPEEEFELYEEE